MTLYVLVSLALAAALAGATFLSRVEYRAAAVRLLSLVGIIAGASLAVGGGDTTWRTLGDERDLFVLAGLAVAASWTLALALDHVEGHAVEAACLAAAGCALPFVLAGEWLVPVLMFMAAAAIAGALAGHAGRSGELVLQLAVGLGLSAAALISARSDAWARPRSLDGTEAVLLIAGVAVLVCPLDRLGGWRAAGYPAASFLPLLHAAAFGILAAADLAAQPWAASGVLAVTLASSLWHGICSPERFAPGPLATGAALAAALLAPGLAVPAGIAAVLSSSVGALGAPYGLGAALAGGAVPLTAGWLVLLAAIAEAFRFAGGSADLVDRLPWLAFVSLAPLVMTAGIVGTVRWMAAARPSGRLRALAGEGALLYAALSVGWSEQMLRLDGSPLGERSKVFWLVVLALLAGGGMTAYLSAREAATKDEPEASHVVEPARPPLAPGSIDRWAGLAGWAGVVALAGMTTFLTLEGLKVGFL